jgi:hypothetical protein
MMLGVSDIPRLRFRPGPIRRRGPLPETTQRGGIDEAGEAKRQAKMGGAIYVWMAYGASHPASHFTKRP